VVDAMLQEVLAGVDLIRRQGLERAGNRLNSFRAPVPAS
jgi:PTH1 family peptidyl-tRNA hydrolase